MALSLVLDTTAVPELSEQGFYRYYPTGKMTEQGAPADDDSAKEIWSDDTTRTLMLRPRQYQPDFRDTEQATTSIIRLADLQVFEGNLTNNKIFEAPIGNNSSPWIFHEPAGPASFFPAAVNPFPGEAPGSPPSLTSVAVPYDLAPGLIEAPSLYRSTVYEQPATMPAKGAEPAPTTIGNTTDGKWLFHSKTRLAANQGLYFRWHIPDPRAGFPITYCFMVGQFCLRVKTVVVEVFRDTSSNGDRTAWKKVLTAPLWSVSRRSGLWENFRALATAALHGPSAFGNAFGSAVAEQTTDRTASLLWLPYRRHQVLLRANTGLEALLTVRPVAQRLADNSDWDITREDTLAVWVMTPAPGHLQIQKLAYNTINAHVLSPTARLDYTPSGGVAVGVVGDADHGSILASTLSSPPAYTLPVNDADNCPPPTTNATDLSKTYGVNLRFQSADGLHTPFFYGLSLSAARAFTTRPTTPITVGDDSSATYHLDEATIHCGLNPGEGRLTAKVTDRTPYTLTPYYYRATMPVQLKSGATAVFTGWTEPGEVIPLKGIAGVPLTLTISALDRWKQLCEVILEDTRDFSPFGHIDAVKAVMQAAAVDTTGMVTPAYTPGVTGTVNTLLGLGEPTVNQQTGDVPASWKPGDVETAAEFIKRIAENFSGWDVGFYLNGTPFYLPHDYYTIPTVTFAAVNTGAPPFYRSLNLRTVAPEANVIAVYTKKSADGTAQFSSEFIDWASIKNPAVVNYIGKRKAEVLELRGSGYTCKQLNWAARVIWNQTRRRHILAEFAGDFVPTLQVGHVVTLPGYGNFRIESIQAEFVKPNWEPAHYTGRLIEAGYGA